MDNTFARKLAENVIVSYLYALIALLLADGFDYLSISGLATAAVAAIPAALAVVKGFLASRVGDPNSPAFTE